MYIYISHKTQGLFQAPLQCDTESDFFARNHTSITQKEQNVINPLEIHENLKLKYMLQNYPKQTLPDRFRLITIIHL